MAIPHLIERCTFFVLFVSFVSFVKLKPVYNLVSIEKGDGLLFQAEVTWLCNKAACWRDILFWAVDRGSQLRNLLCLFIRLPDYPFPEPFPINSMRRNLLVEFTVSWLSVQSKHRFFLIVFNNPEAIYTHNSIW